MSMNIKAEMIDCGNVYCHLLSPFIQILSLSFASIYCFNCHWLPLIRPDARPSLSLCESLNDGSMSYLNCRSNCPGSDTSSLSLFLPFQSLMTTCLLSIERDMKETSIYYFIKRNFLVKSNETGSAFGKSFKVIDFLSSKMRKS